MIFLHTESLILRFGTCYIACRFVSFFIHPRSLSFLTSSPSNSLILNRSLLKLIGYKIIYTIQTHPGTGNQAQFLYEILLPWLNGKPLTTSVLANTTGIIASTPWEYLPRSGIFLSIIRKIERNKKV
jgi:hypothetical protein